MRLEKIFIYPVKSFGGIELSQALVQRRGLQYDRRYLLVDENNEFLTQRVLHKMALVKSSLENESFVFSVEGYGEIRVPCELLQGERIAVKIWSQCCDALMSSQEVNDFFSGYFDKPCRLVYMPDDAYRSIDEKYAAPDEINSFSDAYPLLILGTASLADLNDKLKERNEKTIGWDRFRPNIVVSTETPFEEDEWKSFQVSNTEFRGVKLCSRCVMTTIDQQTAASAKEPLKTLASYRTVDHNVMFGQNVIPVNPGSHLRVHDEVIVTGHGKMLNAGF
jgi:uncharacterized protein YcbX